MSQICCMYVGLCDIVVVYLVVWCHVGSFYSLPDIINAGIFYGVFVLQNCFRVFAFIHWIRHHNSLLCAVMSVMGNVLIILLRCIHYLFQNVK